MVYDRENTQDIEMDIHSEKRFNVFSLNHSTKPIILKGRLEIVL